MNGETNDLDQVKMGAAVVGLCIAQVLTESDPALALRLRERALLWHEQLANRGNGQAAEIVYMFASAVIASAGSNDNVA